MAVIANLDILLGAQTSKGEAAIKSFSGGVQALQRHVLSLGGAFAGFLGARSLINSVFNFAEKVGSLQDFATAVGDTYNNLRAVQLQAELSGTSFEAMAGAITRTETAFSRAVAGGKSQAAIFQALGLSLGQLRNLTPTERLFAIADAINRMPDPAQRAAAAAAVFGKSWSEIGVVLAEGSAGFEAARGKLAAMGGELSGERAEQIKALGDRYTELKFAVGSLAVGPMEKLVNVFHAAVTAAQQVAATIASLSGGIGTTIPRILTFVGTFAAVIAIGPKIIAIIRSIIATVRGMAIAMIGAQAAGGPAGWASAAASIAAFAAATAVAAGVTHAAFAEIENEAGAAQAAAAKVAAETAAAGEGAAEGADKFLDFAKSQDDAAEAAAKLADQLKQRGQQLRESLRTPIEQFHADLAEIKQLSAAGAIDLETARRAIGAGLTKLRTDLNSGRGQSITLNLPSAPARSAEALTTLLTQRLDSGDRQSAALIAATVAGNRALADIEGVLKAILARIGPALQIQQTGF